MKLTVSQILGDISKESGIPISPEISDAVSFVMTQHQLEMGGDITADERKRRIDQGIRQLMQGKKRLLWAVLQEADERCYEFRLFSGVPPQGLNPKSDEF